MKHEVMVYITAIYLAIGTKLAMIRAGGGRLKRTRIIFLSMQPTTPPTLMFSPLFNSVG
jgi:hypothetical protein